MVEPQSITRRTNRGDRIAVGIALSLIVFWAPAISVANTYTVTTTADSGAGSLRQAITDANANLGIDTIVFNITGSGVQTITPGSALPAITDTLIIDGFTQPGSAPNSSGPGLGDNSIHLVELNFGSVPPSTFSGLEVDPGASGSEIRGLVIHSASLAAVAILGAELVVVEGCFLGTDATGSSIAGTEEYGVLLDESASNSRIGGVTPDARNVISGGTVAGIGMGNEFFAGGNGHVVRGNFIGTSAFRTAALPNDLGVSMASGVTGTTIGGSAAGAGNVIASNANGGIRGEESDGLVIQGNFIGTDTTGTLDLGNRGPAIVFDGGNGAQVGGVNPGEGNTIAFNGIGSSSGAVAVLGSAVGITIRGNSIHDNVGIGIDLGGNGVTPNDLGDADTGANGLQNFPVVSGVQYGVVNTTVDGLLNSTPSTTFDLDFYANPTCSTFPRAFLQGETYIGSSQVTTNGSGNAIFHVTTLEPTHGESQISITATDPSGNTSELSQRLPFSVTPKSADACDSCAATVLAIAGTNFLANATVTLGSGDGLFGGIADVVVNSYTSISATTDELPPATVYDIVVTNTDGTTGTLIKGFITNFFDVLSSQQFNSYVTALVSNGITAGVGGGLYGVNDSTLRQQTAVFVLKARHGLCYTPPPCTGIFVDVPCSSNFAPWIEAMSKEGITGGCGGGKFCPKNPVRRDQMAVFLLKAQHGSSYVPPMCTGIFSDVPCPSQFANWIEQLDIESITGGCAPGMYCPGNPITRGQMAVFLTKTFNLQ